MPKQREVPRDFHGSHVERDQSSDGAYDHETSTQAEEYPYIASSSSTPFNLYDAVMQAAPHCEPERDIEQLLPLREVLNQAIEQLDEQERWIFDSLIVRRLSIRQLAAEINMPKSTVHRWKDRACARMAELLADDPTVKEYLTR